MNGLYPIVRRKRRPLVPLDAAPAAPEMPGNRQAQASAETPVVPPVVPPPVAEEKAVKPQSKGKAHGKVRS